MGDEDLAQRLAAVPFYQPPFVISLGQHVFLGVRRLDIERQGKYQGGEKTVKLQAMPPGDENITGFKATFVTNSAGDLTIQQSFVLQYSNILM